VPRLRRVRPGRDAGYHRVRSGSGFRYRDDEGRAPSAAAMERIRALVIPPAWTDVWISADERGHVQAIGVDEAGRTQYLYHPQWSAGRDRGKFARALDLAAALPSARAAVTRALRADGIGRDRVLATSFRLLDTAAPRVGSERYLERHGSRGLTTLRRRDAMVDGVTTSLRFPGKSGKRQLLEIDDDDLAAVIELLRAGRPRAALLAYEQGRRRVPLTPREVNTYVHAVTGGAFTAKDFRTLRGTVLAADALARLGPSGSERERKRAEVLAVRAAAAALGNTPAVARGSYIDPRVFGRYRRGVLLDTTVSPESAIRDLLSG